VEETTIFKKINFEKKFQKAARMISVFNDTVLNRI